jgi:hypothetical protein
MRAIVRFTAVGSDIEELLSKLREEWASLSNGKDFPRDSSIDIDKLEETDEKYRAVCTARVNIET